MNPTDFSLPPETDPAIQAAAAELSQTVTDLTFDLNAGVTADEDTPYLSFTQDELAAFPQL